MNGDSIRDEIIKKRISQLCREQNASLAQIAKKADISPATLQLYTIGKRTPDAKCLRKLCSALGVSADWILGISETKTLDTNKAAVCNFTGLSEEALNIILEIKLIRLSDALSEILSNPFIFHALQYYDLYKDIEPQKGASDRNDPQTGEIILSPESAALYYLGKTSDAFSTIVHADYFQKWQDLDEKKGGKSNGEKGKR